MKKELEKEGCSYRIRVIGIEEGCKISIQGMRRVIRELRRGYLMKVGLAKCVDIIDRYHEDVKFNEIKQELKRH